MKIDELKDKKVLILGFGREGEDTFRFLRRMFPKKALGIADKQNIRCEKPNVKCYFGKNYLKALKSYDIIVKSPGIPFKILPKSALPKITSQTEIFFDNCPGMIIGVTGTKGKGTTASLIHKMLKMTGRKAFLIGNIGKPVLNLLFGAKRNDIFVYELSSHQLHNLKPACRQAGNRPHIAVLLNIFHDHLDYYKNFTEYASTKANITKYQTKEDFLIYNAKDKIVSKIAKKSRAKKIPIRTDFCSLDKVAARAVGELFKIPSKTIAKAIKNLKPLPHRLECVGQYQGIKFYDDSASTIPEATMFALDVLGKDVQTIFLGGSEKKVSFENLAKKILKTKTKNVILFPTTGQRIWKEIVRFSRRNSSVKLPRHFFVNSMEKGVKIAYDNTKKGKICLLSCASASFSLFKNYADRGNLFKKYVKKLAHAKRQKSS